MSLRHALRGMLETNGSGIMAADPTPNQGRSEVLARLFVVAVIIIALLFAVKARGQYAPAGNEAPRAQAQPSGRAPNPFGEPARAPGMDVEAKYAFAKRLAENGALDAFRDLAVQHNNRIKIIDTLARETIGSMVGRSTYYDLRLGEGRSGALRLRYDPLFTFLDMVIDPIYYVDRPVIAINYLPLRDAFLERLFSDEEERESWRRAGRLTPRHVYEHFEAIASTPAAMTEPMQKALGQAHEALQMFNAAPSTLLMAPAADTASPWIHLGTLDPESALGKALRAAGAAWRAGDAEGVKANFAIAAKELPAMQPGVYPTTKRTIERVYNASRPFEYGLWLYALALLSLLLSFGTQRRWLLWTGIGLLTGAVALHGFGFASRCLIAERFAIQNQFESMTGVSLFAALVGVGLAVFRKQAIFAAAASAVGFLVLIAATQMGIPGYSIEREAAILNTSVLLKYHVTTVLVSYGLISLGMIVSLFYLGTHYFGAKTAPAATVAAAPAGDLGAVSAAALGLDDAKPTGKARVLADLDAAQMTILQLAFWTLAVGILLGAWWADHSWGRWWAFDPKELWALVTWIVYLVVVHLRFAAVRDRGLTTAWLSVLGFLVMLWCYFGVNLLLPGLHAYA